MTVRPNTIGVNVAGATPSPEAIAEAGEWVATILQMGFDTHADQRTIRMALAVLDSAASTSGDVVGTTIQESSIHLEAK